MEELTWGYMRAWEQRLGREKVQRAIDIVRSHGWGAGSLPPVWVWRDAFLMVDGQTPEQWGTERPQTSPSIM